MANKDFDVLVFIGRFQPFHKGHLALLQAGLACAEQIIVLCGSAHQPRTIRNPWSALEREVMIRGAVSEADNARIHIAPLTDNVYNDAAWIKSVQAIVNSLVNAHCNAPLKAQKIAMVGHSQHRSSYYVNWFPHWGAAEVGDLQGISATSIRETIFGASGFEGSGSGSGSGATGFGGASPEKIADLLPENVQTSISEFCRSDSYADIQAEHKFVRNYKEAWNAAPYPPIFVTVDAVIIQSGHILMIERKGRPGQGLLALPGGFLDHGEKLLDACLRELREETCLDIPAAVLKGSIRGQEVFDDPYRSARGRTITHAFHIELEPGETLPNVEGSDDARHAMWVPLADLDSTQVFEDHYAIIQKMIGI
ncbi:MAG: bifunctional nicotinamide-nucleotide adenylyltransferase/Nudix hydroxylase [Porticoccaceae bacterium]|nr:bifunctional nicotinamide-nucleotide adenylyltransferase/Nudix hydroxylase [Porticoccaceae bacterium]